MSEGLITPVADLGDDILATDLLATDLLASDIARLEDGLHGFAQWLGLLPDASVHVAHPDGGWTVAQCVSHIQLSAICLVAAIARTSDQNDLVVYREEMGHDVLGATPHSAAEAAARVQSAATAVVGSAGRVRVAQLGHLMRIAPVGPLTVAQVITGSIDHLLGHVNQAHEIIASHS